MKVNVGDTITVKNFTLKNKAGGTTLSSHLTLPNPVLSLIVIHTFGDYETGQRGWGIISEIANADNPQSTYPNFPVLEQESMSAVDAIQNIKQFFEMNSQHLWEDEREEQLKCYEDLIELSKNKAFHNNFLIFFSEYNVISITR